MAETKPAEFTPITTQEEFDHIVGPRLTREREAVAKRYDADLEGLRQDLSARDARIRELEEAAKSHETDAATIRELQARVKGYETDSVKTRIALESGLPYGMAQRLSGDTEDAIRKDAEELRAMMRASQPKEPLAKPGSGEGGAWNRLVSQLMGQ